MSSAFVVESLFVTYPNTREPALRDVSLSIPRGSFSAFIGPNGAGKSTLIRALLGAVPAESGAVRYADKAMADWPRRDFARHVGAVAQLEDMPFPVSVRELVAMGRYPHIGALQRSTHQDDTAIDHALERCDVAHLADRSVASLSGGERQRARIARALAQEPETLVLDEPTAALDIGHEMAVFELLRSLMSEGRTIVVATHHLNLAARYAQTLVLLHRGQVVIGGTPVHVLRKEILEPVYQWPLLVHEHAAAGFDRGAPQVTPLASDSHP